MAAALELELPAKQRDAVQNPPMGGDPAPLPDGWLEAERRERHLALRARAHGFEHLLEEVVRIVRAEWPAGVRDAVT